MLESDRDLLDRAQSRSRLSNQFLLHLIVFLAIACLIFSTFRSTGAANWTAPIALVAAYGTWLLAFGINVYYTVSTPAHEADAAVRRIMDGRYGPQWRTMASRAAYGEVQLQVEAGVERARKIRSNFVVYAGMNGVLVYVLTNGFQGPLVDVYPVWACIGVPLLIAMLWGTRTFMLPAARGARWLRHSSVSDDAPSWLEPVAEKAKRKNGEALTRFYVGDDGELIETPVYEPKPERGQT